MNWMGEEKYIVLVPAIHFIYFIFGWACVCLWHIIKWKITLNVSANVAPPPTLLSSTTIIAKRSATQHYTTVAFSLLVLTCLKLFNYKIILQWFNYSFFIFSLPFFFFLWTGALFLFITLHSKMCVHMNLRLCTSIFRRKSFNWNLAHVQRKFFFSKNKKKKELWKFHFFFFLREKISKLHTGNSP